MADVALSRTANDRRLISEEDVTVLGTIMNRTSWGAVTAGALVAISLQMILTVLGVALGLTAVQPEGAYADQRVAAATSVWWLISGIISLLAGGSVVGRFAGMTRSPDVLLHGLTMWAVTAVFGFFVVVLGAGTLYGTSMALSFDQSRPMMERSMANTDRVAIDNGSDRASNETPQTLDRSIARTDQETINRNARAASWWTLAGLLLGVTATLSGTWLTAPKVIALRHATDRRQVGDSNLLH